MKKIFFVLLLLGFIGYFTKAHQRNSVQEISATPIANPVYAEVHFVREVEGREIEMVALSEASDQADCEKALTSLHEAFSLARSTSTCSDCQEKSSECESELAPRYAKLFENKPTHVTYLSMARGAPSEREARFLWWGVTVEESDRICSLAPSFRQRWTGAIRCIKAPRD